MIEGVQMRGPGRVLLVLDQPVHIEAVKLALSHGAFVTSTARDGAAAAAMRARTSPHIAVVDVDIAQGAVLDHLGYMAPGADRIPVVALTRRGDLRAKLAAFERGVDDILTIPFSPDELVARVLAVMRRSYRTAIPFTPTIRLGELEVDILNRRVQVGARELHLTTLEQSLLYLLAANAGRLLSREEILDALWGVDYLADSNVVDRHISNLRAKLQNGRRRPKYISTVRGVGYSFLPASAVEQAAALRQRSLPG
jgi:DNA-binding response OmpR family regulator